MCIRARPCVCGGEEVGPGEDDAEPSAGFEQPVGAFDEHEPDFQLVVGGVRSAALLRDRVCVALRVALADLQVLTERRVGDDDGE